MDIARLHPALVIIIIIVVIINILSLIAALQIHASMLSKHRLEYKCEM